MQHSQSEILCGIEIAVRTSQAHRRELIQTLETLRQQVCATDSNRACGVFEDLAEANRFLWTEWWSTPEQIEDQLASDRFHALLGAIKVLGSLESLRRVAVRRDDGCDERSNR